MLEVTESRLMADLRAPLEVLTRLRLKRFGLSIDDFGTGHSSLAQLRDMPFDELKIDRGFVHRAHSDPTLRAIFEANLNLARQLGMEVVAEGVEDREDWDFLRGSGCDLAQGYFIARPMPAADLPAGSRPGKPGCGTNPWSGVSTVSAALGPPAAQARRIAMADFRSAGPPYRHGRLSRQGVRRVAGPDSLTAKNSPYHRS